MKNTWKTIRLAIACLAIATSMPSVLHAQAAVAAAVSNQLEEALTSFVWSWHHKGTRFKTTLKFQKDGTATTPVDAQLWRWTKTGPRSAKINYINYPNKRWDIEVLFDESFRSFNGVTGAGNTVLGARLSARETERDQTKVASSGGTPSPGTRTVPDPLNLRTAAPVPGSVPPAVKPVMPAPAPVAQAPGVGQQKANPAAPANAPVPAPENPAKPQADPKAIALHPTWMPDKRAMGEQSIKAMAFYARAALDGAEPGKEIVPTKILSGAGWDLDWLMPLREAEKKLPPSVRMQMGGATPLKNGTWPQNSIFVRSGVGKFLMPGHETELIPRPLAYLELFLICDQQQRLIGVEVRADDRQGPGWNSLNGNNRAPRQGRPTIGGVTGLGGMPTGAAAPGVQRLNPYYDLMVLGANALAGREVQYQIVRNRDNPDVVVPGMTCIHTYLAPIPGESGNFKRNVRLYLATPFARKLVDIAEMYETGKAPSR